MKVRKIILFCLLGILLFFSGCVLAPSINPLYTDNDKIQDNDILGEWVQIDGKDFELSLKFTNDYDSYKVLITQENISNLFEAVLFEINEVMYIDFYPCYDELPGLNITCKMHIIPLHSFSRIDLGKKEMRIYLFNLKWFEKLASKTNTDIFYVTTKDIPILLISPTKDLQKFIIKNKDQAFVTEPLRFRKKERYPSGERP